MSFKNIDFVYLPLKKGYGWNRRRIVSNRSVQILPVEKIFSF